MSHTKIALDPHLRKLRVEGYNLEVRANHLLVHDMPYVTPAKSVAYGSLAVKEMKADESVFHYADNSVARAGLVEFMRRLELEKLAIIGLGGTGSYILDHVAKTPVKEIHLFDDDVLLNHNAFRAPGAPTLDELRKPPLKVDYFSAIYGRMHRGIRPHPEFITDKNLGLLDGIR